MLQIFVYDKEGRRQPLDLMPGSTLRLDEKNPAFDEDITEDTFSYPLDIPFSETNRRALGAPEMLESVRRDPPSWTVDIYDSGLPYLTGARAVLLGHKGDFGYRQGTYTISIVGAASAYGMKVQKKTLKDLNLGGYIDMGTYNSRDFANARMHGNLPQYSYIAFAPIKWEDFFEDDSGYLSIAYDEVNGVLKKAGLPGGWQMGRVYNVSVGVQDTAAPGYEIYLDYRTIPFFNLHFVLRKCFEEYGYSVDGDFFTDADYKTLHLLNNFALEAYNSSFYDTNRGILPSDHVPAMEIAEFLEALKKSFNLRVDFLENNRVSIGFAEGLLNATEVIDITADVLDAYEATTDEETSEGVAIGWKWDDKDGLRDERAPEEAPWRNPRYAVNYSSELNTKPGEVGDYAYVARENYYYRCYAPSLFGLHYWQFAFEAQQPAGAAAAKKKIEPNASPLLTYTNITAGKGMPWVRQPGSYKTPDGNKTTEMGLRLAYIKGFTDSAVTNFPVAFCHNRSHFIDAPLAQTSLSFNAPGGLYERHYKKWGKMLTLGQRLVVKVQARSNAVHRIRMNSKIQIKGVQYLIETKRPTLGSNAPLELLLRQIP